MSTPSADEVGVEELTQEVHEQQIVNRFDYLTTQGGPQRGNAGFWSGNACGYRSKGSSS